MMEAAVSTEKKSAQVPDYTASYSSRIPPRKAQISSFRILFCFPNSWISNNQNFDRCFVCGWKMVFIL